MARSRPPNVRAAAGIAVLLAVLAQFIADQLLQGIVGAEQGFELRDPLPLLAYLLRRIVQQRVKGGDAVFGCVEGVHFTPAIIRSSRAQSNR